jgi:hypothetical protein
MTTEAVSAGYYDSPGWNTRHPRIQILTVKDLLAGTGRVDMPPAEVTFKEAARVREDEARQKGLFD